MLELGGYAIFAGLDNVDALRFVATNRALEFIAEVPHGGEKDCNAGLTGQIKLISKDENKIHILKDAMTAATALIVEHVRETGRRHAYSGVVATN